MKATVVLDGVSVRLEQGTEQVVTLHHVLGAQRVPVIAVGR